MQAAIRISAVTQAFLLHAAQYEARLSAGKCPGAAASQQHKKMLLPAGSITALLIIKRQKWSANPVPGDLLFFRYPVKNSILGWRLIQNNEVLISCNSRIKNLSVHGSWICFFRFRIPRIYSNIIFQQPISLTKETGRWNIHRGLNLAALFKKGV